MEYSYDELLGILSKVHTEPAFSNIKKEIYRNRNEFSREQFSELERAIRARDDFFNPKLCNRVKEIRAYFKDENGHEFSIAYSDGKAQEMCREAKEAGIKFTDYLNRLFAGNNFVAWTLNGSRSSAPSGQMVSLEKREAPKEYMTRGIRRGIEEGMEEEPGNEIKPAIDIAGLLNNLRADMEELVRESMISNSREADKLRAQINDLESRLEKRDTNPEKSITRVLDSSQYRYFMANAYKLGLPVVYSQVARGQYQVSIKVDSEAREKKALDFISEAEKHEAAKSSELRVHSPGYREILAILCRAYEQEAHIPCGLSRTGALSTLASNLADYAHENGIDWQELDVESIGLFAKPGKIYTREQASEAFDAFLASSEGRKIGRTLAQEMENEIENTECADEAILNAIENYDALSYIISKYNPEDPELKEKLGREISTLKSCGFYPNRLDAARNEADRFLRQYGGDYAGEVQNLISGMEGKYENHGSD